ncbi:hypothetical protein JHW43_005832 [Diplocarpon mali]|nr:hypothetical protein JHW43_005832 [Diplocarpon mali]
MPGSTPSSPPPYAAASRASRVAPHLLSCRTLCDGMQGSVSHPGRGTVAERGREREKGRMASDSRLETRARDGRSKREIQTQVVWQAASGKQPMLRFLLQSVRGTRGRPRTVQCEYRGGGAPDLAEPRPVAPLASVVLEAGVLSSTGGPQGG